MNQREAFAETIVLAITAGMPEESDVDDSLGLAHMQSMLDRIEANPEGFSEAKLGRWLGWAQAALVASGVGVTLEDVKQINLRHVADEPRDSEGD